jgi:hypothetical protein
MFSAITRSIIIAAAAALLMATSAFAQRGPAGADQGQRGQGRLAYGVITQLSDTLLVIEPRIPAEMAERLTDMGRELPELPAELRFTIDQSTRFHYMGEQADYGAFAIGDEIVVRGGPGEGDTPVARRVADAESARKFIRERLGRRGQGPGWGNRDGGPGMGQGPGMPGDMGQGMRGNMGARMKPVFGTITALSADSITINIEIPDFVQAKLDERGIELPTDIPDSVTLSIVERTHYAQSSEEVDTMPYGVGDQVAVLAAAGEFFGGPVACIISDYASAEARMAEMGERGPGHGRRDGERPRRGDRPRDGGGHGPGPSAQH